jgi:sugar phosphate isomerase/epimerase
LLEGSRLEEFKAFLDDQGLYVALINGFPYGSFHRRVIKEDVFAPDWRTEERVQYTLRLVKILTTLLPDGLDGGISTSPLSYKGWVTPGDTEAWETVTTNVARVAAEMAQVREETGKGIHLDIEPEPDGLIENTAETIAFYNDWLLPVGASLLSKHFRFSEEAARKTLLNHVRLCYDTCHFAVEYESPEEALRRFEAAGIKIGRVQISSALRVVLSDDEHRRSLLAEQLAKFAESTYLHQVLEQREGGEVHHHPDLIQALPKIHDPQAKEWRIHFHVPLFVEEYEAFGSTQADIVKVFRQLERDRPTRHLEIETYTWDVLPADMKIDLLEMIDREFRWVLNEFKV